MKDLIIEIGDEKIYTDMFLIKDMERLHLLKNEMVYYTNNNEYKRAREIYEEHLRLLYPNIKNEYREYVLIHTIVASEGKSKYLLQSVCEHCQSENQSQMVIGLNYKLPYIVVDGNIKINFNYNEIQYDYEIIDYIHSIEINGYQILWELLSEVTKETIISYITDDDLKNIIDESQMCRAEIISGTTKCCDKSDMLLGKNNIRGGYNLFNILINSDNLPILYKTNHELLSRGISYTDQMLMKPFERNIYVNMIIKKEREEADKHGKDGLS